MYFCAVMNTKLKGTVCGILAAVCYGLNPLALFLYADGYSVNTALFYRYFLAVILLAAMVVAKKERFGLTLPEFKVTAVLGVAFSASSLTFYNSFKLMDAGISCTMLFAYPIMVALIMAVLFKEKLRLTTIISLILAISGIFLLYYGDGSSNISLAGTILVLISALTYAIYIVVVNKSAVQMSSYKLTMYVLLFCSVIVSIYSLFTEPLQLLTTAHAWGVATVLAVGPALLSLVLMTIAVKLIGSTPTAIIGALEPITAVAIGVLVFHEAFTKQLAIGIVLVLTAVLLTSTLGTRKNRE